MMIPPRSVRPARWPALRNHDTYCVFVTLAAKGQFIAAQGLRGFALWEAASDFQDMLIDSISTAMGLEEVDC